PKAWRNFGAWKMKTIRLPRTFGLNHPQRELRQRFFHVTRAELEEIEIHRALSFGSKLFCHQWLPARHSFPVNVTLGFSRHIGADARKIVAGPDALLNPVIGES